MSNVASIAEARRAAGKVEWVLPETKIEAATHDGIVGADGTVRFALAGGAPEVFTPAEARQMGADLLTLAEHGERRQKRLRGACGWHAEPAGDGDYWVSHDDERRRFVAYRVAKATRCPCGGPIRRGDVAFREAERPPEPKESWETRICAGCVERPRRRGIEEVRSG